MRGMETQRDDAAPPAGAPLVGVIANPVSARDIRRVIANATSLQIADRANIVLRILACLRHFGIGRVVMMPDTGGVRSHVKRGLHQSANRGDGRFPAVEWLDMAVTATADDSIEAARRMAAMGVAVIVVLGGDGTHRAVASACGRVPIAGVSTGTNNAFPDTREATVTGLAVGLAAAGLVPAEVAFRPNKRLEVTVAGRTETALVDVAVVAERYVGARALWRTEGFRELFVTFGDPRTIGMSAIAGLSAPVDREAPFGRHLRFADPAHAERVLHAPIAPGLILPVGIDAIARLDPDRPVRVMAEAGSLAFDGEREIAFTAADAPTVTLRTDAFRTVDVEACMAHAAAEGLFFDGVRAPPVNARA